MPPHASSGRCEEFKEILRDLYITQNWELKRVQEYMKTQHGLDKSKSWYTTQLKNWGLWKNLKNVAPRDCEIASYKVAKARKMGKKVDLYFHGQHITPRVLRGERFFLSTRDEAELDNQRSPPRTPPGFHVVVQSRAASPHAAPSPYTTANPQPSFSCRKTHTGLYPSDPCPTRPGSWVAQTASSFQRQPMPSFLIATSPTSSYPATIELDEPMKPRKRIGSSFIGSTLFADGISTIYYNDGWSGDFDKSQDDEYDIQNWKTGSGYEYDTLDIVTMPWKGQFGDKDAQELVQMELDLSVVRSRSQYPELAMIAPYPVPSPLQEFGAPQYIEFTKQHNRRALIDHFCNVLSHLIVFKEDTGNPFRQLVLPLSHTSPPVMYAIYALSSAHLEYRGVKNEEKSLYFHNNALQGLAILIDQKDQAMQEDVLAAIMLLVYYEVLMQRSNSNIVYGHLKGAITVMKSMHPKSIPTSLFLERAFRFYDVITALSLGTTPNANIPSTLYPSPIPPLPSFCSSALSAVDAILGLSTDLWPIIHRLSHLLSVKKSLDASCTGGETTKATVLRTELENSAQAIELALTNWKPTLDESVIDTAAEEIRIQSILNNAEAYRHSAFVYLYRTIHTSAREHPIVQKHTHLSLLACSNVVNLASQCRDGPMTALLWPLFVAACEATVEEDRMLALDSFSGMERRQGMNNIMRAWEVVQEVWARTGLEEGKEVNWRDICDERGFNIVFG